MPLDAPGGNSRFSWSPKEWPYGYPYLSAQPSIAGFHQFVEEEEITRLWLLQKTLIQRQTR